MDFLNSKTEWAKFGTIKQFVFVGKDVVCIGSGCHMMFINVVTKSESLYHANGSSDLGEGISAIAGHRLLPFFSFSEKRRFPKAYVKAYPSFEMVCTLDKKTNEDYITMAFSEGEFLVTLSDTPSFEIIIWNWRNGQRIASMNSEIVGRNQMIRCNLSTPIYFAQIEPNKKRLYVWDIAICGKKCVLTPHKISPIPDSGNYSDILWTTEGTLFLLDTFGHVYSLSDNNMTRVITWDTESQGNNSTSLAWYKAGFVISGPDGIIKHYKKMGDWICDWKVTSSIVMQKIISNYKDLLIGNSVDGEILSYDLTENDFNYIKQYESHFDNMCMIYPVGEYFVTLQHNREITSWEIATGVKKDMKVLQGKALALKENPEYPYVGVSYEHGVLELLSIFDPNAITTMTYFNLSKHSLNSIYFTEIGKLIVCANTDLGEFFIIEGIPGSTMNIIATFQAGQQICDYMLVASRTCMRLFVIYVTSDLYICGNQIARYCIIRDTPGVEVKVYKLQSPKQMYSKIYVTTKPNRDRVFYTIPLATKCINELTTKRGDPLARLTNAMHTGHQMKKILLHTDKHHAITYAYDGLVIIRTPDFEKNLGVVMPHYRTDGGVLKAYVDPLRKYVVSLGRDNTLVCTSLTDTEINVQQQEQLREILNNPRLILMFTRPTIGFTPKGELAKKTWMEYVHLETTKREGLHCKIERQSILAEFKSIQTELSRLLTINIEGPDNEKLDLQEFNLDVDLKEEKIRQSQDECQRTKIYLESLIVAQDKVTQWLKTFCWDSMMVLGQSICGIFSNFQVDNYVMLPHEQALQNNLNRVDEYRKLEIQLATDDSFEPWIPKTTSELNLHLSEVPKITEIEQGPNILDLMEEEEEIEEEKIDLDQITAFNGSVTHLFVELDPYHYTQEQTYSFLQTKFETILCMVESHKLRLYLNKKFGEMMATKEREMTMLMERNTRLRHILSELNYFSVNKVNIYVEDPAWTATERPESILIVDNKEVGISPYISPSEQAMLDAIAAEEERIRLLLLADDFRERALMVMMNGVLEVRWEDELRKDVPIPKFMLEKQPEEFDADDLRAEMAYQEEVRFLNSERERYKKLLEGEYGRLCNNVRDGVKKFNNRLADFLLLKIQVDSGLRHEHLKLCRWQLKNLKTNNMNKNENEILRSIESTSNEIGAIQALITSLNETLQELRSFNDTFVAKEKLLDKAFKKDFIDATPVVQEQSVKLCKRRPKVTVRNINSINLTLELAKIVITQEKSIILTPDCFDFLKSLDALDQYVNIPPAVDEITYALVCKHRRIKIENELRIKAASMEIAEAMETIATFNKLLNQKKELEQKLFVDLDRVRNDKLNHFHDIEIQLVLRGGIVEIPRNGKIPDFYDAVIIKRKDVEIINKIVLRGGRRKIKAMKETMSFRRGILVMEWQHRRLRMQIEDLKSYLVDIDSLNLTKDLQSYLKFKARGQLPDSQTSFEEEVERIKMSYQRIIDDKKNKVLDLEQKIIVLKKENIKLDQEIANVNVDVCEYQLERDFALEEKEKSLIKMRMETLLRRSRLISKIQKNHSDILLLQTELEIMRLKTFPTLSYKILP